MDWSLELEKSGILGEEMTFSNDEKKDAKPASQQFFAQNISMVGDISDNANVQISQLSNETITSDDLTGFLKQIDLAINGFEKNDADKFTSLFKELGDIAKETSPYQAKTRGVLGSIKSICEGMTSNITAQGLIQAVNSLL